VTVEALRSIDARTFNKAFSDYSVPFRFSQTQFMWNLRKNSFSQACSVGLYEEEALCGFVLNGKRGDRAYDCGTAIFPAFRGKGHAHRLVEGAIARLSEVGVERWMLEVITTNTKALALYQEHGFSIVRNFSCFRIDTSSLQKKSEVILEKTDTKALAQDPPCRSSWQNDNLSIVRGNVPIYVVQIGGQSVGYVVVETESGSVMQLFIDARFRGRGYGMATIESIPSVTKNPFVKFLNVDEAYRPMIGLLEKMGFSRYVQQYEMQCLVKSAIV